MKNSYKNECVKKPVAGTTDGKYDRYLSHRFLTLRHAFRLMRSMWSAYGDKYKDGDLSSYLRTGEVIACFWLPEDDLWIPISPSIWHEVDPIVAARSKDHNGKRKGDFRISAAQPVKRYMRLLESVARAKGLQELTTCDGWVLEKLSLEEARSTIDHQNLQNAAQRLIAHLGKVKADGSFVAGILVEDFLGLRARRIAPTNRFRRGSPGVPLSDEFWLELIRVLKQERRPQSQKELLRHMLNFVEVANLDVKKGTTRQRILKAYEVLGWQQERRKSLTKNSN